mmetsp:Transcript_67849/g.201933  ORF Transcript_67849/g.201933 Transcript_67849/m.201933 type:complete len:400 (+) Transcript_67849:142-1341(+)
MLLDSHPRALHALRPSPLAELLREQLGRAQDRHDAPERQMDRVQPGLRDVSPTRPSDDKVLVVQVPPQLRHTVLLAEPLRLAVRVHGQSPGHGQGGGRLQREHWLLQRGPHNCAVHDQSSRVYQGIRGVEVNVIAVRDGHTADFCANRREERVDDVWCALVLQYRLPVVLPVQVEGILERLQRKRGRLKRHRTQGLHALRQMAERRRGGKLHCQHLGQCAAHGEASENHPVGLVLGQDLVGPRQGLQVQGVRHKPQDRTADRAGELARVANVCAVECQHHGPPLAQSRGAEARRIERPETRHDVPVMTAGRPGKLLEGRQALPAAGEDRGCTLDVIRAEGVPPAPVACWRGRRGAHDRGAAQFRPMGPLQSRPTSPVTVNGGSQQVNPVHGSRAQAKLH